MADPSLSRTLRALFRSRPQMPPIRGDALVFGAAPDPEVPEGLLQGATIITANASQVALEPMGVAKPHITCMRTNMAIDGKRTSSAKLKALAGRGTGLLVVFPERADPTASGQLRLLRVAGFQHDALCRLDRTAATALYHTLLSPPGQLLLRKYRPSMGLRAALHALAAGADRVALAGVSLRSSGSSYLSFDYERLHLDGDREILSRMCARGLPVFATDAALAEDTGLPLWPSDQPG